MNKVQAYLLFNFAERSINYFSDILMLILNHASQSFFLNLSFGHAYSTFYGIEIRAVLYSNNKRYSNSATYL
jgi:hypothetical protein